MPIAYFDTETDLIRQGTQFPELACVQFIEDNGSPQVLGPEKGSDTFLKWLKEHWAIVGHNVSYDLGVMCAHRPNLLPLVWAALKAGRIHCTLVREQLIRLARGEMKFRNSSDGSRVKCTYSLEALAFERAQISLLKKQYNVDGTEQETWRTKYGMLRHRPISEWPQGAISYASLDAVATRVVFLSQKAEASREGINVFDDEANQVRNQWWRALVSAHGVRTDPAKIEPLRAWAEREQSALQGELIALGLLEVHPKTGEVKRCMNAAKERMIAAFAGREKQMPRTPPSATFPEGQPQVSEEACDESGDPALIRFAQYTKLDKVLSTDVPLLLRGAEGPIHCKFGMAETGRALCEKPNLQNLRRDLFNTDVGELGIRECFVPRPGCVFVQADYEQLELFTLAQSLIFMLGRKEVSLAKILNEGRDPHTELAGLLLGISSEEAYRRRKLKDADPEFDNARQVGKVGNFGLPGGLGDSAFVEYAHTLYGLRLDLEMARKVRSAWLDLIPEMSEYFHWIKKTMVQTKGGTEVEMISQYGSRRLRGKLRYTQACNTYFQGLGADVAGAAGFTISEECYLKKESPLYGARIVFFVHDEFILECAESRAHDVGERLVWCMTQCEGVRALVPDMKLRTEPCAMRYWSKGAKTLRDENGRLIPWPKNT